LFTLPGMCAFLVNASAIVFVTFELGAQKAKTGNLLLIRLATMAGLFGVVPVALARQHLLCTCDSDLCMRSDVFCKLNQTSIYILMATSYMLAWDFATLLAKLGSPWMRRFKFDHWTKHCVWGIPLLLAAISFAVEDDENEDFHLAKAGLRCQFRYSTVVAETILLHLPMGICVFLMTLFVVENLRLCAKVMVDQYTERSITNMVKVLASRPPMKKLLVNGCLSSILIILWLSQAVASWLVSENYSESVKAWLDCIRFDFARNAAVGEEWNELLSANGNGELCPAYPTGASLFESQLLEVMFEALLPCVVALSFSRATFRGLHWRMCLPKRHQTTVAPDNVALPHHGPSSSTCFVCGEGGSLFPSYLLWVHSNRHRCCCCCYRRAPFSSLHNCC
jgi:hypothetical protein